LAAGSVARHIDGEDGDGLSHPQYHYAAPMQRNTEAASKDITATRLPYKLG